MIIKSQSDAGVIEESKGRETRTSSKFGTDDLILAILKPFERAQNCHCIKLAQRFATIHLVAPTNNLLVSATSQAFKLDKAGGMIFFLYRSWIESSSPEVQLIE